MATEKRNAWGFVVEGNEYVFVFFREYQTFLWICEDFYEVCEDFIKNSTFYVEQRAPLGGQFA
jgi:hypothetical protein